MLRLEAISKRFSKRDLIGRVVDTTLALDTVSASINKGTTLGIIGESGSGKSTLARIALRLLHPTSGKITFEGQDVTRAEGETLRAFRRKVQPVFQDSGGALNPRMNLRTILSEPLVLRGDVAKAEFEDRIAAALKSVDLNADMISRLPRDLSGGQRQRVGIARALLMEPKLIILDEPVSALDVSVQAHVLNLLKDLQEEKGLTYLFIGHDLSVAEFFCDSILVLYHGQMMEQAETRRLFANPQSDYTRKLLAAIPGQ